MLSTTSMTEERTAASATSALALGRPAVMTFSVKNTAQLTGYGSRDICLPTNGNAIHVSPTHKAWAERPLIPDGSGGG